MIQFFRFWPTFPIFMKRNAFKFRFYFKTIFSIFQILARFAHKNTYNSRQFSEDFQRQFLSCSEMGSILACVCYIHCFFIIVRLRNFFPLSLYLCSLPRCCYSLLGIFPSIVVLWGTIVDKWLPIKIVFCCPHLLPVINENEAIYCTKTSLETQWVKNKKK